MKWLVVITGPTAIGKTALSIEVAQHFDTEVISADSRQFFKEMNIGTAKPSPKELAAVPHHLVDFLSVKEEYSAGQFERDALAIIEDLHQHKDVVVMCGGSGLYIKAVTDGFDDFPDIEPAIREELNQLLETAGLEHLQELLQHVDPDYYQQVDIQNPRRVIRALEVYKQTGQPYSYHRKAEPAQRPFQVLTIGLTMDRELLYRRINQRVDQMMEAGLLEEVKSLQAMLPNKALDTVGYAELFNYLDGQYTLKEAVELIKRNTRRYAKRQLTWLRKEPDINWFEPGQVEAVISLIQDNLATS